MFQRYLLWCSVLLGCTILVKGEAIWWKSLLRRLRDVVESKVLKKNKDPVPLVVENFLSQKEAETILERYGPWLRESLHVGGVGKAKRSSYRTSHSVRLPPMGDPLVFEIEQRAARTAGFNHSQVEDFQLACYGVDELYALHRDDDDKATANRAATVLIYLREPVSGGETIFTRKELEKERDMATRKPLSTEKAALDLFRQYCKKPKRHFVVVGPKQGRAVIWRNWYGNDLTTFAARSTHGACPVVDGTKCVIQQWISRTKNNPLRDEQVAAIFTAGAESSFYKHSLDSPENLCFPDVSAHLGKIVPTMCMDMDGELRFLRDGPYLDIGGFQLIHGGLTTQLPLETMEKGMTVTFWARSVQPGTTIVSVGDTVSAVFRSDDTSMCVVLEEIEDGNIVQSARLDLSGSGITAEDWLWLSFSLRDEGSNVDFTIFSAKGQVVGKVLLDMLHANRFCQSLNGNGAPRSIDLRLLSPGIEPVISGQQGVDDDSRTNVEPNIAFVQSERKFAEDARGHADVSFIMLHNAALDTNTVGDLRHQIRRYDLHL